MAKQVINLGSFPNDGTGDPLRTSLDKTNTNFTEIYTKFGDGTTLSGVTTNSQTADYADVAGISTFAQGLAGAPNLNVGIVTANGFISAASSTPVVITHSAGVLTFTVSGIGATSLTLF